MNKENICLFRIINLTLLRLRQNKYHAIDTKFEVNAIVFYFVLFYWGT